MKFDVLNRWSGAVQFSAEIECAETAPLRIKVGLALRWAYKSGAVLRDAVLRDADLSGADLRDADLSGAVLRGADLRDAVLRDADLRGADLRDAVLRDADLRDADLRGADLRGADLSGADLSGAVLRDADGVDYKVDGKIGIIEAGVPNHWAAFGFVDKEGRSLRVHVGCQRREINDGRAYWSSEQHPNREDRREVLAALDYIEAVAKLRGWVAP